jgi:hypothetical protein
MTRADIQDMREIRNAKVGLKMGEGSKQVSRAQEDFRASRSRKSMNSLFSNKRTTKSGRKMTTPKRVRGGGGASFVMNLMSMAQSIKAATSISRTPKALRGKVKGADRKA